MQKSDKPKCLKHNDCYSVCCNQKCQKDPFMCKEDDCQCNINHQQCITNVRWTLLKEKVLNKIKKQQDNNKEKMCEVNAIFSAIQKEVQKFHNQIIEYFMKIQNIDKNLLQFEDNLKNNNYKQMNGSTIFFLSNEVKNKNKILLNPPVPNNQPLVNNLLEQLTKIYKLFEQNANLTIQKKQEINQKKQQFYEWESDESCSNDKNLVIQNMRKCNYGWVNDKIHQKIKKKVKTTHKYCLSPKKQNSSKLETKNGNKKANNETYDY